MDIVRSLRDVPAGLRGANVVLGNFDGVHRGHAHLLQVAHAARPGIPLAVLTFEPHPRQFFRPEDPPFRLTLATERADALAARGVQILYEIGFDHAFSQLSAAAFIEGVLRDGLGVAHLACGADFAFGHRRGGNAHSLAPQAEALGIGLTIVPKLSDEQGPISSTRIRRLLQDGYPERAGADLGRAWTIRGPVTHGDKRGRTIGFPTANVPLGAHLEPARGVYAVRARLPDGADVAGVANLGRRPTVGEGLESRLEVHLFDWDGDLYDQEIAVSLHAFLREERRFASFDALWTQITADSEAARAYLRQTVTQL